MCADVGSLLYGQKRSILIWGKFTSKSTGTEVLTFYPRFSVRSRTTGGTENGFKSLLKVRVIEVGRVELRDIEVRLMNLSISNFHWENLDNSHFWPSLFNFELWWCYCTILQILTFAQYLIVLLYCGFDIDLCSCFTTKQN